MTDKMTPEQRHRCMSNIHSKDTKPEILVRKYLFSCGFRYRIHVKKLPGTPDIVLAKYRTVIFINGCFWHGHDCDNYHAPKSNIEFWEAKINRNKKRDYQERIQLRDMGWHVIQVWECQLKPKEKEFTLKRVGSTLNKIFLENHKVRKNIAYHIPNKEDLMVAEDFSPYSEE